jgi:hypothetical protein
VLVHGPHTTIVRRHEFNQSFAGSIAYAIAILASQRQPEAMFLLNETYVRWHVRIMNVMARAFGVMACLVGIMFAVSSVVQNTDRAMFAIAAAISIAIGVVFLVVKPITADHIYAIAGTVGYRRERDSKDASSDHGA